MQDRFPKLLFVNRLAGAGKVLLEFTGGREEDIIIRVLAPAEPSECHLESDAESQNGLPSDESILH